MSRKGTVVSVINNPDLAAQLAWETAQWKPREHVGHVRTGAAGPFRRRAAGVSLGEIRPLLAEVNRLHDRLINGRGGGLTDIVRTGQEPPEVLQELLAHAGLLFHLTLVDLPEGVAGARSDLLDQIGRFVVAATQDLEQLELARAAVEGLFRRNVPSERIVVVLGGFHHESLVTVERVRESLGVRSVVELAASDERAAQARDLRRLAARLLAAPASAPSASTARRSSGVPAPAAAPAARIDLVSAGAIGERYSELKERVLSELHRKLDLKPADGQLGDDPAVRREVERAIQVALDADEAAPTRIQVRELLVEQILAEAIGWGPLEGLLRDPAVQDIMVNGLDAIFTEKEGRKSRTPIRFTSERQLERVVGRVLAPLGRAVNESTPFVDARLPQGYRVNVVVRPVATGGVSMTIRKFPQKRIGIGDLLASGTLNRNMRDFLVGAIGDGMNVVLSGGTGSGKTTLLSVLADFVPPEKRVITLEDTLELCIEQPNLVRLEARPANLEGKGEISIRDLVRNALRMSPDVVVIGEMRGAEAFDVLQAMNSGHQALSTVHSNSTRDCLSRLEALVQQSGLNLTSEAVRESIMAGVDLIVQVEKREGRRRIVDIAGIRGFKAGALELESIFWLGRNPRSGADEFRSSGRPPVWLRKYGRVLSQLPKESYWL